MENFGPSDADPSKHNLKKQHGGGGGAKPECQMWTLKASLKFQRGTSNNPIGNGLESGFILPVS